MDNAKLTLLGTTSNLAIALRRILRPLFIMLPLYAVSYAALFRSPVLSAIFQNAIYAFMISTEKIFSTHCRYGE